MAADLYSIIEEKNYDEGIAFVSTHAGGIFEVHLYGGIIVFLKSLRMSFEQIYQAIQSGDIKEVTFRKSEIKPETAQAKVVAFTFPAAVNASAIDPSRKQLPKMFRIVRLMSSLTKSGSEEGTKVADAMYQQITKFHRGFLPDLTTFKNRVGNLGTDLGISTKFLDNVPFPADIHTAAEWAFTNFEAISDAESKEMALDYVLFGEKLKKMIKMIVEQETSLGAKPGFGILSKTAYPELTNKTAAVIYKGTEKVGQIKIDWQSSKKTTLMMTKGDLEKLKVHAGEEVMLSMEG